MQFILPVSFRIGVRFIEGMLRSEFFMNDTVIISLSFFIGRPYLEINDQDIYTQRC